MEPILIYTKGQAVNLYQIMLDQSLPFSYIATSNECYRVRTNLLSSEYYVKYEQNEIEGFRNEKVVAKHPKKIKKGKNNVIPSTALIELFVIGKDDFVQLCDMFPDTAHLLQTHCLNQMKFLSKIRQKKDHLHVGNFVEKVVYRKKQLFMEHRLDEKTDLSIKIHEQTKGQQQLD